ncbi:hypothetical protein M432DRAFT_582861 [Thermoascus aurantiacus ATCC 26904]
MRETEILVHVSAPSGARDDARYRAQVEAILGFETVSRRNVFGPEDAIDVESTAGEAVSTDEVSHNATGLTPEPPDKERDALSRESHPRSDSLATPLSVIPDSQPERQPISKNDLEEEKAPSEKVQVARSFYAETAPPSSKRRRLDPPSSRKGDAEADESIPSSVPDPEEEHEVEQSRLISLSSLPLEIHPPPPPVSTEKFKSHITPTLHMLAERLKLSRTYRPTRQTRELHPLERGFWLLLINVFIQQKSEVGARNNWTLSFFTRFWSFLSDFIAKEGRAGWGVWCILEEAQSSGTDTAPSTSQRYENGNNTKSLTLKVYAWGEVAAHVYLLLFLASERRIRGMRAQWKDGVEETVIEMP